jgi:hypothetical protein
MEFWSENLKGKDQLGKLGIDKRIILEWILEEQSGQVWTRFMTQDRE